jgi:glutaredoxin
MNINKWLLIIGIVALSSFSTDRVYAQSEEITIDKLTLFVLDTCPHCNALLEDLNEVDYSSLELEIVEITPDDKRLIASKAVSLCNLKSPAVPLLYDNGTCYVGSVDVSSRINQMIGDESSSNSNNDLEDTTDFQEIALINDSQPESYPETSTGNNQIQSLADRIDTTNPNRELPKISFGAMIVLILAPATFIGLTIYLLKKFQL